MLELVKVIESIDLKPGTVLFIEVTDPDGASIRDVAEVFDRTIHSIGLEGKVACVLHDGSLKVTAVIDNVS